VAPLILLDTHVVVWLYAGLLERIPPAVQERLNREQLGLSPFVELELAYLHEVGRIAVGARVVVEDLRGRIDLLPADVSTGVVCTAAQALSWTRDPFDRLLAAQATAQALPLVTRDEALRRNLALAWWG